MKKIIFSLLLLFLFSSLISHPAKDVELSFDDEKQILTVEYNHPVKNAEKHFIFEVKIKVNKKEVITQFISKQESAEGGTFLYKMIDLKTGDKIKVTTNCNKNGKKSATLEIK